MLVVSMLSQQRDGALCVIRIKLWHVKVIDKVDEFLLSWWSILLTGNLFQKLLQLNLKIRGVSIIREVDQLIVVVLGEFLNDGSQDTLGQLGLTATCQTDQ